MSNIEDLRSTMGTLPARTEPGDWAEPVVVSAIEHIRVIPVNPVPGFDALLGTYKALFSMATATWGDANIDGNWHQKWDRTSPADRFRVVWNVLHRNTLPTPLEAPKFTWEVVGLPRHSFDQHARTRIGAGFASIGCRDNSKMPAEFVLYPDLLSMIESPSDQAEARAGQLTMEAFRAVKRAYAAILETGRGSYQMARAVLPLSYHHQEEFTQNLISLVGLFARRSCLGEEAPIVALAYWLRHSLLQDYSMNMVADIMRPPCHRTKRCHYVGSHDGGGGLFSNLFAPMDPVCRGFVEDQPEYAEFNRSCTTSQDLIDAGVPYVHPGSHLNIPEDWEAAKPRLSDLEREVFLD